MTGSAFTAVYDACVSYLAPLRDFRLWLGLSRCFQARWSARIHGDWKRSLLINRPALSAEQLDRTSDLMDRAIPDAWVTGFEPLMASLSLPDPDDRHVLAAAIHCHASVIVAFNERDFPSDILEAFEMEAQYPDVFGKNLFDLDPASVVAAAQRQRQQLRSSPMEVDHFLDVLHRQGLPQTAKALSAFRGVL